MEEKQQRLLALIKDERFQGSVLLKLVQAELKDVQVANAADSLDPQSNRLSSPARNSVSQKLKITSNAVSMRSQPRIQDSLVLRELEVGEECIVLGKGEAEKLGDKIDYWYKVQYAGQEGWIFGYYTSLRSATAE